MYIEFIDEKGGIDLFPIISEHELILQKYHQTVESVDSKFVDFDVCYTSFTIDNVPMSMGEAELTDIKSFVI
jgi:hypothetical protein